MDSVYVEDNIFDKKTIDDLMKSCQKHFDNNLLSSDFMDITKSIIDCHGLALSDARYYPYPEECWNIFCMEIKSRVEKYCSEYPSASITPFSCWSERVDSDIIPLSVDEARQYIPDYDELTDEDIYACDSPAFARDKQIGNKKMLRCVYNLLSPAPMFGTTIFPESIKKISAKNNRLTIYDGSTYMSQHLYPEKRLDSRVQYNIIFDWYINIPFNPPDWILP